MHDHLNNLQMDWLYKNLQLGNMSIPLITDNKHSAMKWVVNFIIFLASLPLFGNCWTPLKVIPKQWTYELIEMTFFTSNSDILGMEYEIERIDRGRYGFSGFLDFKRDFDDNVLVEVTLQRSKDKSGPFKPMPMKIDNVTLSTAMNMFYKTMIMDAVAECCDNAPVFEGRFVAPLTKRRVQINKCEVSTDGLPDIMLEGYYKLRTTFFADDFSGYLDTLVYIEN
ncbi:uncharacterized protein LOC142239073 [Haematobia irritans]|uniref:uncharacterized protein LOC142239073 n=1 Tax=Haematobia irritans TaxID=7368 RepID=UPI003F50554B